MDTELVAVTCLLDECIEVVNIVASAFIIMNIVFEAFTDFAPCPLVHPCHNRIVIRCDINIDGIGWLNGLRTFGESHAQ